MLKKIKDLMGKKDKDASIDELKDQIQENADQNVENESVEKKSKKKSGGKTAKLKEEIEELTIQVAEQKDKHLRLLAEFENFKKRSIREKLDTMSTAAQDTMSALLPILDDFDRAKKVADDESTTEVFTEGVNLVYQKLFGTLTAKGLKVMETHEVDFDPELHEAITDIPAPTPELKGKVIDTIEKGYLLNDKIIRYAKVVVGK